MFESVYVQQIVFYWTLHIIYGIALLLLVFLYCFFLGVFFYVCFVFSFFFAISYLQICTLRKRMNITSNILIFIQVSKLYFIFWYVIVTFWMLSFFFYQHIGSCLLWICSSFFVLPRGRDEYKHFGFCPNLFVCSVNRW